MFSKKRAMFQAFKQGFYGRKYVWILVTGRYEGKWWNVTTNIPGVDCTPDELRQGMSNVLGTGEIKLSTNKQATISNLVSQSVMPHSLLYL